MAIAQVISKVDPTVQHSDLSVTQEGPGLFTVRVAAGTIRYAGTDYTLDSDHVYTVTPDPSSPMNVTGYLAYNSSTDELEVVVDEVLEDGEDISYDFANDADRDAMFRVFYFRIPAAAINLAEMIHYRTQPITE